jgi:hypothetical protein
VNPARSATKLLTPHCIRKPEEQIMAFDSATEIGAAWRGKPKASAGDPTATKPREAKRVGFIVMAALLVGLAAVVAMFMNNSRYDGTSPIPFSERR